MKTDERGVRIVLAWDCCELFQKSTIDALAPLPQCWFCKFSEFRLDTRVLLEESPCHHLKNQPKEKKK